jgi:hypothetical protein
VCETPSLPGSRAKSHTPHQTKTRFDGDSESGNHTTNNTNTKQPRNRAGERTKDAARRWRGVDEGARSISAIDRSVCATPSRPDHRPQGRCSRGGAPRLRARRPSRTGPRRRARPRASPFRATSR